MKYELKTLPGDIFIIRNHSILGKCVRLLISIRYGIPFKKAYSHIESTYNETLNISAEPAGVKFVKKNRFDKKTEYCVYRLKKINMKKQQEHQEIAKKFVGKGYAYSWYVLDFIRICSFFLLLAGILFTFIGVIFSIHACKKLAIISGGLVIFVSILKPIFYYFDVLTYDCTELQSIIFANNGLWIPQEKARNEYPDSMKQVLDNLVLNSCAEIVYQKYNTK